jgi:hypothetical protein
VSAINIFYNFGIVVVANDGDKYIPSRSISPMFFFPTLFMIKLVPLNQQRTAFGLMLVAQLLYHPNHCGE